MISGGVPPPRSIVTVDQTCSLDAADTGIIWRRGRCTLSWGGKGRAAGGCYIQPNSTNGSIVPTIVLEYLHHSIKTTQSYTTSMMVTVIILKKMSPCFHGTTSINTLQCILKLTPYFPKLPKLDANCVLRCRTNFQLIGQTTHTCRTYIVWLASTLIAWVRTNVVDSGTGPMASHSTESWWVVWRADVVAQPEVGSRQPVRVRCTGRALRRWRFG